MNITQKDGHLLWIVGLLLVAATLVTMALHESAYDDTYITYRCARNLAMGHGLVYNRGESVSAATSPLLTVLLAVLGRATSVDLIPAWGSAISGASLFALALLLLLHARDEKQAGVAMVAIPFLFANPLLEAVWGGEGLLAMALSLSVFYFYFRGVAILPGMLAFLAFLARGEGVLPLVVIGGHAMLPHRKLLWKDGAAFLASALAWLGLSRLLGTSVLPDTLAAKVAQMQSGAWGPFVRTTLDWFRAYIVGSPTFPYIVPQPILLVLPVLAAVGFAFLLWRPSVRWWCMVVWLFLYASGYSILAVPFYSWYAFPLFFGVLLLAGVGHRELWSILSSLTQVHPYIRSGIRLAYAGVLLAALIVGVSYLVTAFVRGPTVVQKMYTRAGLWFRANTPPETSVGFFEIGYFGYFADRRIIDPMGLVNPGVTAHVAEGDFAWAFRHYKPDYIALTSTRWHKRLGIIREREWFKNDYERVESFDEPGYFDSPLVVYKRCSAGPVRRR